MNKQRRSRIAEALELISEAREILEAGRRRNNSTYHSTAGAVSGFYKGNVHSE